MGFHWDVFVPCCLFTSGLGRGRSSPSPQVSTNRCTAKGRGRAKSSGREEMPEVPKSGTTKAPGSHLKLKGNLRKDPQKTVPLLLTYVTPSGLSLHPIPFASLVAKPGSFHSDHLTQLRSLSPQLSLQVSHAPFCLQSSKLTAGNWEPPGKANSGQLWSGSAVTAALGSREGLACPPHAPRKG